MVELAAIQALLGSFLDWPMASSEPTCFHDQKQSCHDGSDPNGPCDAFTRRCKALGGNGCRHKSHGAQIHDPHYQKGPPSSWRS